MDRRIVLGLLAAVAVLFVLGIVLPALLVEQKAATNLPWQMETNARGHTRVFGITLEETTVTEAERLLGNPAEVTLFNAPNGEKVVEAYVDQVTVGGFSAKMVLGVDVPEEQLEPMYDRGVRAAKLGSGTQKVTLASADLAQVREMPVDSITYMPSFNLSPEDVQSRFGVPAERRRETGDAPVEHWLYPERGLDVAISEREKEVLQYVPPAEFARLTRPLEGVPVVR